MLFGGLLSLFLHTQNSGHFFSLFLGAVVSTNTPLSQSESLLIKTVSEQFQNSLLVRSITSNFSDDFLDDHLTGTEFSLAGIASASRKSTLDNTETLVKADGKTNRCLNAIIRDAKYVTLIYV